MLVATGLTLSKGHLRAVPEAEKHLGTLLSPCIPWAFFLPVDAGVP